MFNICLIGEGVVESDSVIEVRLTKWLHKFIQKGGRRFYIGGDVSFSSIELRVASHERKKDLSLRYFCTSYMITRQVSFTNIKK